MAGTCSKMLVVGLVMTLWSVGVAAQTLVPVPNPAITDSSGKFVGHILSYGGQSAAFVSPNGPEATVLLKYNTEVIILRMQKPIGGALSWVSGPLFYTSGDCTGQAYLQRRSNIVDREAVVGPGNALFVEAPGSSQTLTVNSVLDHSVCLSFVSPVNNLAVANSVGSLDGQFQAPFRIVDASIPSAPAVSPTLLALLFVVLASVGLVLARR